MTEPEPEVTTPPGRSLIPPDDLASSTVVRRLPGRNRTKADIRVGEEAELSYETPVGTVTERFLLNEQSPNIPWVTKNKVVIRFKSFRNAFKECNQIVGAKHIYSC